MPIFYIIVMVIRAFVRHRSDPALENLALRKDPGVYNVASPNSTVIRLRWQMGFWLVNCPERLTAKMNER